MYCFVAGEELVKTKFAHAQDFGTYHMGLDARKPVFRGLQTTKAQPSLRGSAPLLFAFWKGSYLNLLQEFFYHLLASLCS